MVDARLLGEAPRRDPRVADLDEQPLGGVQQRLLGGGAGRRLAGRHGHERRHSALAISHPSAVSMSIDIMGSLAGWLGK